MAHIVTAELTFGSHTGIKDFYSLDIQENIDGHHQFFFSLPMHIIEGESTALTKAHELIGETFHVELKDVQENTYLYDGIITNINFQKNGPNDTSIGISGTSPTILLDDHEYCRTYLESSLDDIVQDVVGNYQVSSQLNCSAMHTDPIAYSSQYKETSYNYISRLAQENGEWFYYNGEKIIFGSLQSGSVQTLKLGDELYNYGFQMMSSPLKDVAKAHDYLKDEVYDSGTQFKKVKNLTPFTDKLVKISEQMFDQDGNDILSPEYQKKKQVEKKMEYAAAGTISGMQILTGTSSKVNLHIGTVLDITTTNMVMTDGVSQAEDTSLGKFTVINISHSIGSDGNYTNRFDAIPDKLIHPPSHKSSRKPVAFRQMAIVVDNNDPDKIGRVVVRFPWMSDDEQTPWIRVATPHAAEDNGMYFIPEIEDHVMVDFENADPDCPYVTASLYHGKAKPAKWHNGDNMLKAIKTKSGNEILFDDTEGKEAIHIFNKEKTNIITLSMDGDKLIRIESAGDIEMEAKNIKMKADNITMKANNNFKSESDKREDAANEMLIEASQNIEISAGMDMALASGAGTEISAGTDLAASASVNATFDGGVGAEVTGGATAKVEGGAMLELKGGAMANLTAGLVNIN